MGSGELGTASLVSTPTLRWGKPGSSFDAPGVHYASPPPVSLAPVLFQKVKVEVVWDRGFADNVGSSIVTSR